MKPSFNFVFNLAALFVISEAVFKCPTLFNWYPDIYDCSRFYRCMWGKSNSFTCPAGTLWSQELLTCDHKDHVKCDSSAASAPIYHAHGHTHVAKVKNVEAPDFSVDYKIDVNHLGGWDSEEGDYHSSHGSDSYEDYHDSYEISFEHDDSSHDGDHHSHEHDHNDEHGHDHGLLVDHSGSDSDYHSHEHLVSDPHSSGKDDSSQHEDKQYEDTSHSHDDSDFIYHGGESLYSYEDSGPVYESPSYYQGPVFGEEEKSLAAKPAYIVHQPVKSTVVQQPASVIVKSPQPLVQPPAQIVVQQPQKAIQVQPPILLSKAEIVPTNEVLEGSSEDSEYADYILNKLLQLPRYGGHFYKPVNIINTDGTFDVLDLEVSPVGVETLQKIEPYKSRRSAHRPRWPMSDFFRAGYGYKKIYHKK